MTTLTAVIVLVAVVEFGRWLWRVAGAELEHNRRVTLGIDSAVSYEEMGNGQY